jgi:hypothetical protein
LVEKMDVGIHQKGSKLETSVLVSGDDSKIETDLENESTVLLTAASSGVDVVVAPILKEFTDL